jgi:hypothetical protein
MACMARLAWRSSGGILLALELPWPTLWANTYIRLVP